MCLVPIRGWPHRVTGASNGFAGGGALSVVEPSVSSGRGMGRSVRCGCQAPPGRPHDDRQRRLLYCRAVPLFREGDGEKCLQSQARVTRPWCGPGGYIQVGMRGCEPCGGPRAIFVKEKGRSLHSVNNSPSVSGGEIFFCCYPGSLPREGEAPGGASRVRVTNW